jgi:hypothetical protein
MSSAAERAGLKGRLTIRRAKPGSKSEGPRVGIWDIQPKAGSRAAALEKVYLDALNAVDGIESRKAEAAKSGKYTADGIKADALQHGLQLSPVFKRGRAVVDAARKDAADLRSKLKLQPADPQNLVRRDVARRNARLPPLQDAG